MPDVDPNGMTSKRASLFKSLTSQKPLVVDFKHEQAFMKEDNYKNGTQYDNYGPLHNRLETLSNTRAE